MHELSICQALIRQVDDIAREQGAEQVEHIVVRIGALSGVEPDLLAQAYSIARAGTVAEHARLHIERTPARVRCRSCGAESDVEPNRLVCTECGDWQTVLIAGDEMLLASVELTTY